MLQILFHVPFTAGLVPPDGVPIYGFGVMLFLCFVVTAMVWGPGRAAKIGLPRDRLQDLAIILFVTGIAGARVVYMIQYSEQFPKDWPGRIGAFFQIWNGGIVVYGALFGGLIGYLLFYYSVLRRYHVSGWRMADAVAPLIALGLAVGRLGCYLNGCCWGQPVAPEVQPVPLSAALGEFPLIPAHCRDQVCGPVPENAGRPEIYGLQTSTGFTTARADTRTDPRTVVAGVEPGSAAEHARLKPGDRIVGLGGEPNAILVDLQGPPEAVKTLAEKLAPGGENTPSDKFTRLRFDTPEEATHAAEQARAAGTRVVLSDEFTQRLREPARGRGELSLTVDRAGERVPLTFTPRTVPLFPTQLYETLSMGLLVLVLVTFQPLRRRDGEVIVLLMLGYAMHRFLNEALRIEPTYQKGLTLSQWISLLLIVAAFGLELYLRLVQPKLPNGLVPLGYGATPVAEKKSPTTTVAPTRT